MTCREMSIARLTWNKIYTWSLIMIYYDIFSNKNTINNNLEVCVWLQEKIKNKNNLKVCDIQRTTKSCDYA